MADDGKDFWERTASRYDLSMRILGGPLQAMLPLVTEAVTGRQRVLEVAAGTGLVTCAIAPVVSELLATDYADAMVKQLQARVDALGLHNVRTQPLDLYSLQPDASYDAVVAANVLHLVPDLDGALHAMVSALSVGGRLVVPTYCHDDNLVARTASAVMTLGGFPGQRRFTLQTLVAAVEAHGLTVRQQVRLPGLLPIGFVVGERTP